MLIFDSGNEQIAPRALKWYKNQVCTLHINDPYSSVSYNMSIFLKILKIREGKL